MDESTRDQPARADLSHSQYSLRVIKLGGSLLAMPNMAEQLALWWHYLAQRRQSGEVDRWLIVVGGGAIVDTVREWEQHHGLTSQVSHHLALAGMKVTAQMVSRLMNWPLVILPPVGNPGAAAGIATKSEPQISHDLTPWIDDVSQLSSEHPLVVDLSHAAAADPTLPESWDVTSDSLALWLAQLVGASSLVLLKAVSPLETPVKLGKICGLGWVDAYFSRMWSEGPSVEVQIAHFSHCPHISQVQRAD
ncbi:MAG: hypothetical protein JNL67_21975 [Planctomycetaceae bacterium]|nr:hypothetical protein [Planctomycetaceae bacterium]